ncbi:hypothetical protein POTOM_012754 [Populus tomentosa]|uniref:Uncharacterized protein n=1 Tax=Populus tomentosa TaxID=118781 RepID=A0A8X8A5S9_POPTO|nr:hypothetical protein POTOM_012754 [Populus tomentosa]
MGSHLQNFPGISPLHPPSPITRPGNLTTPESSVSELKVRVTGRLRLWKVSPGGAERLSGFEVGDWVRFKPRLGTRPGILFQSWAACWKSYPWTAHHIDVEKVTCFKVWQHVEKILRLNRYLKCEWEKLREDVSSWKSVAPGSGFVVQGIRYDGDNWGSLYVGFSGEQERWAGPTSHLERAERLMIGQKVRVKLSVKQPRLGWSGHTHGSGARRG